MPYPGIITSNPAITISTPNQTVGPFSIGGVLYVFLPNTVFGVGQWSLNCFKSTDLGLTWTQIGGDSPGFDTNVPITCVVIGTTVYCCTRETFFFPTEFRTVIIPFDTVAETFGASIDTGISQLSGGVGNEFLAAAYRVSDNSIIICYLGDANPSPTRLFYVLWDVGTQTTGAPVACGDTAAIIDWDCAAILVGTSLSTFLYRTNDGGGNTTLVTQTLSNSNVLGALTVLDVGGSSTYQILWSIYGDTLLLGWTLNISAFNPVTALFEGPSAEPFVGVESDYTYSEGIALLDFPAVSAVLVLGSQYLFLNGSTGAGDPDGYVIDGGAFTTINNPGTYNNPVALSPIPGFWGLLEVDGNAGQVLFFFGGAAPAPASSGAAKALTGGGTFFPRFINKTLLAAQIDRVVGHVYRQFAPLSWLYDFPNGNDICLAREWRLYNQIDPKALSCGRKPDCFSGDDVSRPWVEAPAGAITFNPDKAIPLPAPAATNVVVLSFRVPIAYDGIILAQYHAYRGSGTFIEGSGDIVWRVRVNGRYLRDMGNMLLSLGSPQQLSPCPGGLWIHSGDLVEYVVSAPNTSGNLPLPGDGNILAGLHGWFFPRI